MVCADITVRSPGFGGRLGEGEARDHHRIDNLVAAPDVCHDDTPLAPADEQEIDVLDRKLPAIGQMNGKGMKRLLSQHVADFTDSHELAPNPAGGKTPFGKAVSEFYFRRLALSISDRRYAYTASELAEPFPIRRRGLESARLQKKFRWAD
jgi:hypothetical protein